MEADFWNDTHSADTKQQKGGYRGFICHANHMSRAHPFPPEC